MAYQLAECGRELVIAEQYATEITRGLEKTIRPDLRVLSAGFGRQATLGAYLDTLAWVYWKQGSAEKALPLLQSAAEVTPNGEVIDHLATVEWQMGKKDQAIDSWRRAIELMPGLAAKLPPDAASRIQKQGSDATVGAWKFLGTLQGFDVKEPVYGIAIVKPDGTLSEIRPVGPGGAILKMMETRLRGLQYPVIYGLSGPIPSFHVLKIWVANDGQLQAYRSTSDEAMRILMDLAPDQFAVR